MTRRNHGVALVTALAVLVVVSLLVVGVVFSTRIELFVARNDATATEANYVAQAGLQKYKADLFQYYRWLEQTGVSMPNPARTACFNRLSYGIEFDRSVSSIASGNLQYTWDPTTHQLANPTTGQPVTFTGTVMDAENNAAVGSYSVKIYRDPNNNTRYSITSTADAHGAKSTARASFTIRNTGVLEQAIFSGVGQANKYLNGGGTIHGGVYIVGGDANASVFDSNGNFSLVNDYNLSDTNTYGSGTMTNGPQLAQYVTSDNRSVSNLCSTLQVQTGKVNVGGSVNLGTQTNKLLGVYISGGTSDINGGGTLPACGSSGGICSDDIGAFTIENPPDFPTLDGPPDPQLCSKSTWRQCIHADATSGGVQAVNGAVTTVLPGGAHWLASNFTTDCEAPLANTTLDLTSSTYIDCRYQTDSGDTYGFLYDGTHGTPATFEVYGSVDLQGYDVTFNQDTVYKTQPSTGTSAMSNASFVVEANSICGSSCGNVTLNGDLLPDANTTNTATQFPNNVLGLIAEKDVTQNAQYVMGPLYAGNRFRTGKDKVLVGSVISNDFCTTTAGGGSTCNAGQKADIVYVNTANNKPKLLKQISPKAGIATFKVDTYELK